MKRINRQESLFGGLETPKGEKRSPRKTVPRPAHQPLISIVPVRKKSDWINLLQGFRELYAVSFVATPEEILECFELGIEKLELVIGDSLTGDAKKVYTEPGPVQKIGEMVAEGKISIYTPKNMVIHSKVYIMKGDTRRRVVLGSFNLTRNAFKGRQLNHAVVMDDPPGEIEDQFWQVFVTSRDHCDPFMEDLVNLFRKEDHVTAVRMWLSEEDVKDGGNLILLPRLAESVLQGEDIVVMPRLTGRKDVPEEFRTAVIRSDAGEAAIDVKLFARRYHEVYKMPIMHVGAGGIIFLGADLVRHERNAGRGTREEVDEELAFIEGYLCTVDGAKTSDPSYVKTSMYEALLYCLFAPFFNEYMKIKRHHIGLAERRGPRYLYLLGPSSNGKSTFLTFAYKLVTGQIIIPSTTPGVSRRQVFAYSGNALFVAFDDIHRLDSNFETVLKSYWEMWWKEEEVFPQLVFASNKPLSKKWAETRTKVIKFDVKFENTSDNKRRVHDFLSRDTKIFPWFAQSVLERLYHLDTFDDELQVARGTFLELYGYARREVPAYFPSKPLEELYDINRHEWELLRRLKRYEVRRELDRLIVDFSRNLEAYEVDLCMSYLPQSVKAERKGRTIIIDTPEEFQEWIGPAPGLLATLGQRLRVMAGRLTGKGQT